MCVCVCQVGYIYITYSEGDFCTLSPFVHTVLELRGVGGWGGHAIKLQPPTESRSAFIAWANSRCEHMYDISGLPGA